MTDLDRITLNPDVMGGKACIRGLRVTVGTVVGLLAAGTSETEILRAYPYLEVEDIRQALSYAAWRAEEIWVPLLVPDDSLWTLVGAGEGPPNAAEAHDGFP